MADAISGPNPRVWRSRPRAPKPGTLLCAGGELAEGQVREFVFGRGTTVFSMIGVRKNGKVYGYLNLCPHYSQPLNYRSDDFLNEAGDRLRCTMHFAEFRIEDGYGVSGAAERCWLDPVPLVEKDGDVFIAEGEAN
ncbi:Rieske 2Fe-2S domain-containing protein [Sinorhizobium meliloti]|uniref:Rieske (2Fe-2S) protein n=1 Tax=Rhizobium meliloti TaxID=382 RepID=UPI003F14FDDA